MYFLGIDVGSSSIKVALIDGASNRPIGILSYPETEMEMISVKAGWAEQDPELWWECIGEATRRLIVKTGVAKEAVKGIGIAYQMHGLVLVDKNHDLLRPSIIWCDSRAVEIGEQAMNELGTNRCFEHLLNSPGNFTASKLKWVREHEPDLFARIHKIMLPGDYVAMKMTDRISTTIAGLSEGMMWDFKNQRVADFLLDHYGINPDLIPEILPVFSAQGELTRSAAETLGLSPGIPVGYRAGDQPNNAMSLAALAPGEVAATGGTSGVVYGLSAQPVYDPQSRINSFAHVNYSVEQPLTGALLCINGAGIQYRWIKQQVAAAGMSYADLENSVASIPIGADGLSMLPFGNGAERMLQNRDINASVHHLQFNRHTQTHLFRAALEGIAFAFVYGIDILKDLGLPIEKLRVGNDNLFQSEIFSNTIATLTDSKIEVVETTGAVGAARAAAYTTGHFTDLSVAMSGDPIVTTYQAAGHQEEYAEAYARWCKVLEQAMKND